MPDFKARVVLYSNPTTPLRALTGARVTFTSVLDDPSVLTLTVPLSVAGDLPTPFYAAVEVRDTAGAWVSPRNNLFTFRERTVNQKDPAQYADFTGVLYVADRLAGALIGPTITVEGAITWLASSAGTVMADLMTQIPGHGVTRTFTASVDSAGTAWPAGDIDDKSASLYTPAGEVLSTLARGGYVSWHGQDTELRLLVPGAGVTRTTLIGPEADSVQVSESVADTASTFYVVTDTDVATQTVTRAELGAGPRSAVVTVAGATTSAIALRMATPLIDAASRVRRQVVVTYQAANLPALPFIDFQVGDNFTVNGELLRLVGVQVSTDDATVVQLTFGELFYTLAAKLAARTATLTLGSGQTTVGTPLPAVTPPPAEKPGVPTIPILESDMANVHITWDGLLVTGSPASTVRGVIAEAAASGTGPWVQVGDVFSKGQITVPASAIPVDVGTTAHVRLRAVNIKDVLSNPSTVATVSVAPVTASAIDVAITDAITAAANAAAAAQATADGKSTISPNAPVVGDGSGKPVGALWWRRNGSGLVIGLWEWSGSAWTSRPFDDAVIGNLNAGKITAGFLDAARIEASSIATSKLLVGSYTNLVDDPNFVAGLTAWSPAGGGWSVVDTTGVPGNAALLASTTTWHTVSGPRITAQEGEQFFVSARVQRATHGAGGTVGIRVYFRDKTGADIANSGPSVASTAWATISGTATAPANTATAQFVFIVSSVPAGTAVYMGKPLMAKRQTGELIVDGAITGTKLSGDAIDGKTITGALIRTAASGQRLQLDTTGLRSFDSGGSETANLSASSGGLTLSGTLRSGSGNQRAEMYSGGLRFYNPSNVLSGAVEGDVDLGQAKLNFKPNGTDTKLSVTNLAVVVDAASFVFNGVAGATFTRLSASGNVTAANLPSGMAAGSLSITPSAANTPTSQNVSFPAGMFSVAPVVTVTAASSVPGTQVTGVGVTNVTATGCTIWVTRTNTTSTPLNWIAVQM